jgi:hypothetical protein
MRLARPMLSPRAMASSTVRFATSMSRFLVLVAIGACSSTPSTSLVGTTSCEGLTCGSGDLCVEQATGVPNDGGVSCIAVAANCPVRDCADSTCPTCIAQMCAYYPELNAPVVQGRTLSCPGE